MHCARLQSQLPYSLGKVPVGRSSVKLWQWESQGCITAVVPRGTRAVT